MNRMTCYFSGDVQGVGFRYTTQNLVIPFDVTGYVRNLPDGRVELVMEGSDEEMKRVLEAIEQRMDGFIRKMTKEISPATGEFKSFGVRH